MEHLLILAQLSLPLPAPYSPPQPVMSAFAAMNASGTTSTGSSTTFLKQLELEKLGMPTKDETNELIKRLIKNVVEIKDTTGEFVSTSTAL